MSDIAFLWPKSPTKCSINLAYVLDQIPQHSQKSFDSPQRLPHGKQTFVFPKDQRKSDLTDVFSAHQIILILSLKFTHPHMIHFNSTKFHLFKNLSIEKNEWERTRIWYGSMFIEASDTRILSPPDQIEIASVDDLVNLAEQDQRPIFHILDGDLHHLLVQTPEQNYHYAIEEKQRTGIVVSRPEKETKSRKWYFPRIGEESKVRDAYEHALKGWANAVNHKLYEEGEADRLAEMAYELGKMLDIHGTELENIRMAAYLYKIGLTDVPDEILAKKKKLTKKELEILRSHPTYARNHLDGVELLKPIAEAIYYQHERWDGSGQPDGLKGDQIPIGARVISIVNTWNGLSRARPYRDAWIIEDIRKYFLEQSGKQFDPRIVDLFLTRKDIDYPIVVSAELQAGDEKDA